MSRSLGNLVVKDPVSDEPWGMDWTDFVDELGVSSTIVTSTWTTTRTDGQPSDLSGTATGSIGLEMSRRRIKNSTHPAQTNHHNHVPS